MSSTLEASVFMGKNYSEYLHSIKNTGKNLTPNDEEVKVTIKAARRKLEVPMPAAMPCKIPIKSSGEAHRSIGKRKTKYVCRREHETKGRRSCTQMSSRSHLRKRREFYDSLQSCSQVYSDASNIKNNPDAKAAVNKE